MRTLTLCCACAALAIGIGGLSGCGGDNNYGMVEGMVTLDGQPLENGAISFVPVDGETATAGERIENGVYQARVPIGAKRIEINASRVVGQRAAYAGEADSPQKDMTRSLIPPRYNTKSGLTLEVAAGENKQDFDLKSK
ncbi:hypothetical protein [Blastopirellula retiformator]|uniref:Carboxypeptidase regulatory-like domain-containing protein n=1 Tax=Blastopirellula retiformator TaxID=2527970 RepID=A0A5C5VKP3_9BACT|nr:hypothetical protein [Blastopirellula retiformator]TWT38405.1 hypothetical protein Enr8_00970 [Blastopirellula retiformator]